MTKLIISADSVSLTYESARDLGFTMVPCPISFDGRVYLDSEIDLEKVYARLETRENLPKTSSVNVEEFVKFFTHTAKKADCIVHISMSSVFSLQYNNALQAKTLMQKKGNTRIEVFDSSSIGIGVHLVAIMAGIWANEGSNLEEISGLLGNVIPNVTSLAARDTLFYYDKGGRIFEAKTWAEAEEASSFRSIIEVDSSTGGTVKPLARAKTVGQIIDKLVEITKERAGDKDLFGAIGYTRGASDRAEKLKEMLMHNFNFQRLYVSEESASVAIHNGTGFIDYAFCVSPS